MGAAMANKIAEIEIRLVASAIWSVETPFEPFRRSFIYIVNLGLCHARERDRTLQIESKSAPCRAFFAPRIVAKNIYRR